MVGVGVFGRNHTRVYKELEQQGEPVRLVGVVDPDLNRADAVARHLVAADAKRVPFADQSVGMVTSNSLIHHIPDPRAVFLEIARIARRGALILIRDLVRPETQGALERLLEAHAARWSPLQRTLFSDSLHASLTLGIFTAFA